MCRMKYNPVIVDTLYKCIYFAMPVWDRYFATFGETIMKTKISACLAAGLAIIAAISRINKEHYKKLDRREDASRRGLRAGYRNTWRKECSCTRP